MTPMITLRSATPNAHFSAAHFLVMSNGERECLHGHNYRVAVTLKGHELNDGMLIDFTQIAPAIELECQKLDHHLLLPTKHPLIHIHIDHHMLHLVLPREETMSFPARDAVLLPIPSITVEYLSAYIAQQLAPQLPPSVQEISVEISERDGESATTTIQHALL